MSGVQQSDPASNFPLSHLWERVGVRGLTRGSAEENLLSAVPLFTPHPATPRHGFQPHQGYATISRKGRGQGSADLG